MRIHNDLAATITVLLLVNIDKSYSVKRDVKTTLWPNCDKFKVSCNLAKDQGYNVVYSKASTLSHDNLLYAFSTIGVPAAVVAHTTGADVDMQFDWDKLMNSSELINSISFSGDGTVKYKFGVAFTKLIEFDDKNDTADMATCQKNGGNFSIHQFDEFTWQPVELHESGDKNSFTFNTTINSTDSVFAPGNGTVSFTFMVRPNEGRASQLPALKYLGNETQIDVEINGVQATYNHSRFAVEVAAVSQSQKAMTVSVSDSIDDEYSPGVFKISNWKSDPSTNSLSGYVQWKPVAYVAKSRSRASATEVTQYSLETSADNQTEESLSNSLLHAVFKDDLWNEKKTTMSLSNMSFGLPKDGTYLKNNYTEWTLTVGYGKPPKDSISLTVIIIISAGLGVPVLIIIFGGLYTVGKKCKKGSEQEYRPIGESNSVNT